MDKTKIPVDIISVVDKIVERFNPEKIYLFSNKRGGVGKTSGFKLCVILDCSNMAEVERQMYLSVDSEVPFDLVLHDPKTFEELCSRSGSFAQRIVQCGVLVYG